MKRMMKLAAGLLLLVMVTGCATVQKPSRAEVINTNQELASLQTDIQQAKSNDVDFFAPDGYATAKEALDDAVEKAINGDPFKEKATASRNALEKAKRDAQENRNVMREVIGERDRAKTAGAPTALPEKFTKLETQFQNTMRLTEKGQTDKAKKDRGALIAAYADLELNALKRATVSSAKEMIAKAEEAGAKKYAPKTLALSKDELALAVNVLDAERTEKSTAEEHATRSLELAQRSLYIADTVKVFDQRDFTDEEIVLWYQEQLTALHKPLPGTLSFMQDNHEVVTAFQGDIENVMASEAASREALQQSNVKNEALSSRIAQLEQSSTAAEESYKTQLKAAEKANIEAQARYQKVQAMFTPAEAIVYRQGHNVLLTTYGFDFAVGGSEISSDNYDLLNKIIQAIKTFDDPYVLVTGHTDSTGSEETNQALSQKRAETVASFLKKVGQIPDDRVNIEGYGESRPVASNETKEGRAKNRRIEILIINKQ